MRLLGWDLYYKNKPTPRLPLCGLRHKGLAYAVFPCPNNAGRAHTQKSFSLGAGWLVCRSLLLLFLRNQIILVEYSAHKHSDSVNAAHANKRTVYKMIDVHGVLGMYTVVCWIEEYKKQGSVLWL